MWSAMIMTKNPMHEADKHYHTVDPNTPYIYGEEASTLYQLQRKVYDTFFSLGIVSITITRIGE